MKNELASPLLGYEYNKIGVHKLMEGLYHAR